MISPEQTLFAEGDRVPLPPLLATLRVAFTSSGAPAGPMAAPSFHAFSATLDGCGRETLSPSARHSGLCDLNSRIDSNK